MNDPDAKRKGYLQVSQKSRVPQIQGVEGEACPILSGTFMADSLRPHPLGVDFHIELKKRKDSSPPFYLPIHKTYASKSEPVRDHGQSRHLTAIHRRFVREVEGMATKGKLLSQDDVDAILTQSGLEGNYESPDTEESHPPEKKTVRFKRRSQEEAKALSYRLFNKAFLEREEGVSVIWNAAGTMPMDPGMNVRIQGKDYLCLGILHEKHLIVAHTS